MAARGTRATDELRRAGIPHAVLEYDAPEKHGEARDERPMYGLEAAAALGVDPSRIHKTLVAEVDGRLACAVVGVDRHLDLKALADALGGRKAAMAGPVAAERATGFVVGGISPIGQRRRLPTVVDARAMDHARILVSAGRRGLQIELAPADLVRVTGARVAPISRAD
jgi:Cys-tRNA(Pro)/Cys-tRNA(Cys) deacylase